MISTPNKVITSPNSDTPRNKFHFHEWTIESFLKLFKNKFKLVELYAQNKEHPLADNKTLNMFSPIIGAVMKNVPGAVYKFIKTRILQYPSLNILRLKIPQKHQLIKVTQKDFNLNGEGRSYAIMIGIFKKK